MMTIQKTKTFIKSKKLKKKERKKDGIHKPKLINGLNLQKKATKKKYFFCINKQLKKKKYKKNKKRKYKNLSRNVSEIEFLLLFNFKLNLKKKK